MSTEQGADERRIRQLLVERGVGLDAAPPPATARPADDWWDRLYTEPQPTPTAAATTNNRLPDWRTGATIDLQPEPDHEPREHDREQQAITQPHQGEQDEHEPEQQPPDEQPTRPWQRLTTKADDTQRPAYRTTPRRNPRQALIESWHHMPPHLQWLAYRASAAYTGWELGLVDYATHVTAWIAEHGLTTSQAWFWYGAAAATGLLYRRTSRYAPPIAWAATIPAASTVTGVLLYAPGI